MVVDAQTWQEQETEEQPSELVCRVSHGKASEKGGRRAQQR
jgi:hypothetical protein